jgi:uncharacterized protein (TIGR02145 family)
MSRHKIISSFGLFPAFILAALVSCHYDSPEFRRDNPLDTGGDNWRPPLVTAMDDVEMPINDTFSITAEGEDENGTIEKYYWALDGSEYKDSTAVGTIKISFPEPGIYTVLVKARDDDGLFSSPDMTNITVNLCPPLLVPENDTIVSRNDVVNIIASATDTNADGSVEKYFWDKGADGWDDSTDSPQYDFSLSGGGLLMIVWGARDDDGVISTDTFSILFNRPPSFSSMTNPADGGTAYWTEFSSSTVEGTINFTFPASDSDGNADTSTYTVYIGKEQNKLSKIYSGREDSVEVNNLDIVTTYYWRILVRDLYGDSAEITGSFITPVSPPCTPLNPYFTDARDSIQYKCVEISAQIWMAENLNHVPSSGKSWCPGDGADTAGNPEYCKTYGLLYDWSTAVSDKHGNGHDVCPREWHLPTDEEWKTLEIAIGMSPSETDSIGWRGTTEGKKLKSKEWGGTDDYGFNALPAGFRISDGVFLSLGYNTYFWTATEDTAPYSWFRLLDTEHDNVSRVLKNQENGLSVRCVKD